MATVSHQQQQYELKANEQLVENIKLLATPYPCRHELYAILKDNTFLKPNQNAFNEVVYFLFHLEHMKKTAEMLVNWPPSDEKSELALSDEVIKHVTELNAIYVHAEIPILEQSQLVSPDGVEIVFFLLKWSALCLFEHLNQSNMSLNILYPFKPNKNPAKTEILLKVMQNYTDRIQLCNRTIMMKKLNLNLVKQMRMKYKIFRNDLKFIPLMNQISSENDMIYGQIHQCYINFFEFQDMFESLDKIEITRLYCASKHRFIRHNKEEFKIPEEIQDIVKNETKLNLSKYFEGMNKLLENRLAHLPSASLEYLEDASFETGTVRDFFKEESENFEEKLELLMSECQRLNELFPEEILSVPTV